MIRGQIRYICDAPGCHRKHYLKFKAGLHVEEIDPPEGWGEDKNGRILCPNHYHPAPAEPPTAITKNVYKIMGKTYLSMNALLSLMTTLENDMGKGDVINIQPPRREHES